MANEWNADHFEAAVAKLSDNFMSSSHSIRLNTARVLRRLENFGEHFELNLDSGASSASCFDIIHEAESIFPLTMDNYRNRLLLLRKLSFEECGRYVPTGCPNLVPLKILIGQLNVNFALIWEPLVELIEGHVRGLGHPDLKEAAHSFWQFFANDILQRASERAKNGTTSTTLSNGDDAFDEFWQAPDQNLIDDDRPDPQNFRYLLWRVIEKCSPDCVEWKTRHLSPLVLDLAETEMNLSTDDLEKAKGENLVDVCNDALEGAKGGRSPLQIKTLVVMLRTFSRFKDMKSISKEPSMRDLYQKLLMHKRNDVQTTALECILAYKSKNLAPYREYFEQLLDNKKFRDALVLFQVDSEDQQQCVVDPRHRAEVIPLLMRLLYGRMLGKDGVAKRKTPIFHFLAGCTENELNEFLRLQFLPVASLLTASSGSLVEQCQTVIDNYDLRRSVPPSKLLGVYSNLHVVFRKLGHLFSTESRTGFWRLLAITSAVVERMRCEKQADRLHQKHWRSVKSLNKNLLTLLVDFFVCFGDEFNLDNVDHADDLKAIFATVCSQSNLMRFSNEGVSMAAGGLLSLFNCWSQNDRLASLLDVGPNGSITALRACVQVLLHPGCSVPVQNRIVSTLKQLSMLSFVDGKFSSNGVELLKPFVPDILRYMRQKLMKSMATNDARENGRRASLGGSLSDLDLQLLSRLTISATEADESEALTELLLPGLGTKRTKSEALELDTLITLGRLVKNIGDCSRFHEPVARLFSKVKSRASREALCDLWCAAFVDGRRTVELTDLEWEKWGYVARCIRDWNSWDEKRLEEPDFGRRTSAYYEIKRRIDNGEILSNVHFARLIMHDCGFVALENGDSSLRDNAAHTLRKLIESLPNAFGDDALRLVNTDLLPLLKRGFKSQQEAIRLEFVSILASAALSFPTHPRFVGLDSLAPVGGDPDTDLFENLKHIQLHRRGRALRRLSEKLEEQAQTDNATKKISSETIYLYFLPLCLPWPYVDAVMKHQSSLIEEVVRLLSTYCRYQVSWKRYESLLKYFLNRLQKDSEKQKMTVKLLVGLLDSFRYDLKLVNADDVRMDTQETGDSDPTSLEKEDDENKTKIFNALSKFYIPRLQKAVSKPLQTEVVHRTMRKAHYDEDEQILRIPLALALVKLLKKLPTGVLESNLPGILYKVCQMLKSRSFTIRDSTRKTLCSMATELGPRHLRFIVREMRSILTRGYQVHVLIFSVHALLNSLAVVLEPGDLDPCLKDILEICNEDLFGEASEEKEVAELTKKLKEARAQKTYVTYGVLGSLTSVGCLEMALQPLKKMLESNHSLKVVTRVADALRHFAIGFSRNKGVGVETALAFVHRTLSECLPALFLEYDKKWNESEEVDGPPVRQKSCLILEAEPQRAGATSIRPKTSRTSNFHVLVEFSLDALFLTLKKAGSEPMDDANSRKELFAMVDPYMELLYECSTTIYTQTVASALRCLSYLARWHSNSLPSFRRQDFVKKLLDRLFVLLNQYAGLGRAASITKGKEFAASAAVLAMAFKTMATVLQNVGECQLSADQLRLLLHYVDEDLLDRHRQAAAFSLIKAILERKYQCEKEEGGNDLLTTVMRRIRDMSIVNQTDHIRAQCRQLAIKHAINYGLLKGKKSRRYFEFYCAQLSYEYEDGRISALETLSSLFDDVEQKSVNKFGSMVFVFLAMRLIEDESAKCKKLVAVTTKNLIRKLDVSEVNALFAMTLAWLQDDKIAHKQLGAHLISLFVEAEGEKFCHRLATVLSPLGEELARLRFDDSHSSSGDVTNEEDEVSVDRLIYLLLATVRKICDHCPSLIRQDAACVGWMNKIWDNVKAYLCYPHPWIQLISNQLFGILFAAYVPQELSLESINVVRSREYLMNPNEVDGDEVGNLWLGLSKSFIAALRSPDCQADLAEQAIKNLVFVARVVMQNTGQSVNDENRQEECDLVWLSNRLVRICRLEISKTPRNFSKRSCVFKWIAAVALHMERKDQFDQWLPIVLAPLYREMNVEESEGSEAKQLASEVCDVLKRKVGLDKYSRHWITCQRSAVEKRTARKRKIAEETVTNPEAAAQRKVRRQKKKAESRKRKLANSKLTGRKKPRRTVETNDTMDD